MWSSKRVDIVGLLYDEVIDDDDDCIIVMMTCDHKKDNEAAKIDDKEKQCWQDAHDCCYGNENNKDPEDNPDDNNDK